MKDAQRPAWTLGAALERLLERADSDPLLRADLLELAKAALRRWEPAASLSEPPSASTPPPLAPVPTGAPAEPLVAAASWSEGVAEAPAAPFPRARLEELSLGPAWAKQPAAALPAAPPPRAVRDDQLRLAQLRLAARAAILRKLRLPGGPTQPPVETHIEEERARHWADALPWNVDASTLQSLAEVLETCTDAAELLRLVRSLPEEDRAATGQALVLAAEAQSMLRALAERLGPDRDEDQELLFQWLRHLTYTEQYFVPRFMRLDDLADPRGAGALRAAIRSEIGAARALLDARKRIQGLWGRLEYHAHKLRSRAGDSHDWRRMVESVEALLGLGVRPSDPRLRELLVEIFEELPERLPHSDGFEQVQRALDAYLALQPREEEPRETEQRAPDPRVAEARPLLHGKTLLLIGGHRRPGAEAKLEQAFGCKLRWCSLSEQAPRRADWENDVLSEDVHLVVLMIRWMRHVHGDVAELCARIGKPCVRLPGGYHPNQVAAQVLEQVSRRL